jgi:hypothetical protein
MSDAVRNYTRRFISQGKATEALIILIGLPIGTMRGKEYNRVEDMVFVAMLLTSSSIRILQSCIVRPSNSPSPYVVDSQACK